MASMWTTSPVVFSTAALVARPKVLKVTGHMKRSSVSCTSSFCVFFFLSTGVNLIGVKCLNLIE